MRVVHLCTNDISGAANAAIRLHQGLNAMGIHSTFISKYSHNRGINDHISFLLHKSWRHILNYGLEKFNLQNKFPPERGYSSDTVLFTSPHSILHPELLSAIQSADIIHLHWISHFIDYNSFFKKIDKPIVWTLHDMNPFTGGCHYSGDCKGYLSSCDACPQLKSTNQPNASVTYFDIKIRSLQMIKNLTLVAPSDWILNLSKASSIFGKRPHHHIHNGVNELVFRVLDNSSLRQKWNIPSHKINLLFVSHSLKNRMKGLDMLVEALKYINNERFHLTILGKGFEKSDLHLLSYTYIDFRENESEMTEIYNTADLYICPSLRDNFPNTILESLFCGTPVLAFKTGGMAEMIEEGVTGLYATELNAHGIAAGINTFVIMRDGFERNNIHNYAVSKYSLTKSIEKYKTLYTSILESEE